jgi:hypothetical protein
LVQIFAFLRACCGPKYFFALANERHTVYFNGIGTCPDILGRYAFAGRF